MTSKEFFPIIVRCKRFQFMLLCHPRAIHIFTDHKNLIYMLKPEWSPKLTTSKRLKGWSLLLQNQDMIVHHVQGEKNVLADILSRWYGLENQEQMDRKIFDLPSLQPEKLLETEKMVSTKCQDVKNIAVEYEEEVLRKRSAEDVDLELVEKDVVMVKALKALDDYRVSFLNPNSKMANPKLKIEDLKSFQGRLSKEIVDQGLRLNQDGIYCKKGKIFIPKALVCRLLVFNHIVQGHSSITRDLEEMNKFAFEFFTKQQIRVLVKHLRNICMHCQRRPSMFKTTLEVTKLAARSRQMLLADFLFIVKAEYLLVIIDSFTRFTYLKRAVRATANVMMEALLEFRCNFGLEAEFVILTDRGSHFVNSLMTKLQEKLRFSQVFSISYAPWTNGGVEVQNSSILKYVRQFVNEFGVQLKDWRIIIPLVQFVLKSRRMKDKGNVCPFELFLGFTPSVNYFDCNLSLFNKWKELEPNNEVSFLKEVFTMQDEIQRKQMQTRSYIEPH